MKTILEKMVLLWRHNWKWESFTLITMNFGLLNFGYLNLGHLISEKTIDILDDFWQIFRTKYMSNFLYISPNFGTLASIYWQKSSLSVALFNKVLTLSPVIELLPKTLLESKEVVKIFSSNNSEIGFWEYIKGTIMSLKI